MRSSDRCWFFTFGVLVLTLASRLDGLDALGCATDLKQANATQTVAAWAKYWNAHAFNRNSKFKRSPSSDLTSWSSERPWGGSDASAWRPEAIIANAASEALERGFSNAQVDEVLVSVPVKMLYGNNNDRPYGDGQTNAAATLGTYQGTYPPVVASWLSFSDGTKVLNIRFSKVDGLVPSGSLMLDLANGAKPVSLGVAQSIQNGLYEISWKASSVQWGDLYQNHVAYLQLPGKSAWYPLDFRDTVKPASELLANVPPQNQSLSKGTLLDPEAVSAQSSHQTTNSLTPFTPFTKMYPNSPHPSCKKGCPATSIDFGGDLHATRYSPVVGVHNQFIDGEGSSVPTAVGNGDTTVIDKPDSPFKMAYICFDGRNLDAEKQFGVPSGGGWHEIGDPAETVMNTLETASPLFGYANGKPGDDREYAYGLSDVTVIRKLRPGMALVTAAGTTTTTEDATPNHMDRGTGPASGRNYHWFAFEQPSEVCAVEWVHPCVPNPSNHMGLMCR